MPPIVAALISNKNYNDATIQLAEGSAGFRERYLNELRELKSVSELKDRQWDMNQMQPYLDKMQAANQLLNAGNLNAVNSAVSSMDDNPIEFEVLSKILSQRNKHLNWVERGLNPDNYPKIKNEDGSFSTHRLAYATGDNGEAYVYPTIIQQEDGTLKQLSDDEALNYALKTKTAMQVPNVKLAEYYSQNGLIKH